MIRTKIFFFSCLYAVIMFSSCYKDKGNYDYWDINEVSINGFGGDTTYKVLYLADTLRFNPEIKGTIDGESDHYSYIWALSTDILSEDKSVISNSRNLVLPIDMQPGTYTLHYKVKDENTDIQVSLSNSIIVETSYTKGFLVLGDREDETVQLDMIAMIDAREDTTILRDMLSSSGLPELKKAVHVCHTGSYRFQKLWIMSETGSYYLDGATMTGSTSNNIQSLFYTSMNVAPDAKPISVFPQIAMGNGTGAPSGFQRGYLLNDGSLLWSTSIIADEFYGNPVNRLSTQPNDLIDLFPYVFYGVMRLSTIMVYETEKERFLFGADGTTLKTITDQPTHIFPWNQEGTNRTLIYGDNTRNTLGGASYGRSYALMKDNSNDYFIYAFGVPTYSFYAPSKLGFWKIDKEKATNIDKATRFLFSSSRSLFYYVVGGAIYCYDYTVGAENCQIVKDFKTDEITWWAVDYWTAATPFDRILVATYNSTSGGTLQRFIEDDDPNKLQWTLEERCVWSGFPKIKSVAWRNSAN